MEFEIECPCESCNREEFISRLRGIIQELAQDYPAIAWFGEARVIHSPDVFWKANNYESMFAFIVSCGVIKSTQDEDLKRIMIRLYYDSGINCFDDNPDDYAEEKGEAEVEDDPGDEYDNLTKAIMRLETVREIKYPIEIVPSGEINAHALLKEGKIQITSAATERLFECELAFIIAHERAHLDKRETAPIIGFIDSADAKVSEIIQAKDVGIIPKALGILFIGAATIAAVPLFNKKLELDCDYAAKEWMIEAGYSQDEVESFFIRFGSSEESYFSSHPTGKYRRRRLED